MLRQNFFRLSLLGCRDLVGFSYTALNGFHRFVDFLFASRHMVLHVSHGVGNRADSLRSRLLQFGNSCPQSSGLHFKPVIGG
ncbi:hypothetical protein ACAN107058_16585 [Paracidovorax anthurii]